MSGDNRVAMSLALPHRPFREIKPQARFAHLRIGPVATEATAGKDGLYILIEVQMARDLSLLAVAPDRYS
jgi:hypothetical protein